MQTEKQQQNEDPSDMFTRLENTAFKEEDKRERNQEEENQFDLSVQMNANEVKIKPDHFSQETRTMPEEHTEKDSSLQMENPKVENAYKQDNKHAVQLTAEEMVAKMVGGMAIILGFLKEKKRLSKKEKSKDSRLAFEKIERVEKINPVREYATSNEQFPGEDADSIGIFEEMYFPIQSTNKTENSQNIIRVDVQEFIDNFKGIDDQPIDWKTTSPSEIVTCILRDFEEKRPYNFKEFLKNIYLKLYQNENTRFLSEQRVYSGLGDLGRFEEWLVSNKIELTDVMEAMRSAQYEYYKSTREAHPQMVKKIWTHDLGKNMGFTQRFLTNSLQEVDWRSISYYEIVRNINRIYEEDGDRSLSESMIQDLYYKLYVNENYGIENTLGWEKLQKSLKSQIKDKNAFHRAEEKARTISQQYSYSQLAPFAVESYLMLDADKVDLDTFKKGIQKRSKNDVARYPRLEVLLERMYDAKNPNLDAFCTYVVHDLGYPKEVLQKKLYKKFLAHEKTDNLQFEEALKKTVKQLSLKAYARKVAFFGEPGISKKALKKTLIMPSEFNLRRFKFPKKTVSKGVWDIVHDEKDYKGFKVVRIFTGHSKEYEMTHPYGQVYVVNFDRNDHASIKLKDGKEVLASGLNSTQQAHFFAKENQRIYMENMDKKQFFGENNPFIFGGKLVSNPDQSVDFVLNEGVHSGFFTDACGTTYAITKKGNNTFGLYSNCNGKEELKLFTSKELGKELLKKSQFARILQLRAKSTSPEDARQVVLEDIRDKVASIAYTCEDKNGKSALAFHIGEDTYGKSITVVMDGAKLNQDGSICAPAHLKEKEDEIYKFLLQSRKLKLSRATPHILKKWQRKYGVRILKGERKLSELQKLWSKKQTQLSV